jgi:dTDP-4-amino-4,6-dideoxygalactose transaminase
VIKKLAKWLKRYVPIYVFHLYHKYFGNYPSVQGRELRNLREVLAGTSWNMSYGKISVHHQLEEAFANFTGAPHAIAISSGGMGIQAALRASGLTPGSEVFHQVDVCPAVPFSVINAHLTPKFLDISPESLMLDVQQLNLGNEARSAVIATHIWGNPENIGGIQARIQNSKSKVFLLEDCCLALGTKINGKHVGTFGDAGIFSFGSTKQLQAGEGGMVITKDESLAKEIRALRHWAERRIDFNENDIYAIGLNGRMSEFIAAIVLAQLKEYPRRLSCITENVLKFSEYLGASSPFNLHQNIVHEGDQSTFSQVTLTLPQAIETRVARELKERLTEELKKSGVNVLPGNFVPLNQFEIFKNGAFLDWTHKNLRPDKETQNFPNAKNIYENYSIGIPSANFINTKRYELFRKIFSKAEFLAFRYKIS